MPEISEATFEQIKTLCEQGDQFAADGVHAKALAKFLNALDLIPDPKTDWEAATWVLTAVGDTYFILRDYPTARDYLSMALRAPGGFDDPFLHLRLGQSHVELGNEAKAVDELKRAHAMAGAELFEADPKYFEFLQSKIEAPPEGW